MPLFPPECRKTSRSYGSWIYIYIRTQCLSPLRLSFICFNDDRRVFNISLWWNLSHMWWVYRISPGTPVSSNNKIDSRDIHTCNWNVFETDIKSRSEFNLVLVFLYYYKSLLYLMLTVTNMVPITKHKLVP